MSNKIWNKVKLGEIAEIIDSLHQTPTYSVVGYPMVRVTDINGGYLNLNNTFKVSKDVYELFSKKHKTKKGDLVMSRVGTYGIVSYINSNQEFCLGQNTLFIIPKQNSKYLYYFLSSPIAKIQIESFATGSTQKTISLRSIKEIVLSLPDLPTQTRIASILSAIDDKIELNRQMNQTLEQMAKALFKKYFVDDVDAENLPEGWRMGKLGEISRNIKTTIIPKDEINISNYIGLEHMPRNSWSLNDWSVDEQPQSQKFQFKEYDILFGKLRPYFHKVVIAPINGICSTDILVLNPSSSKYLSYCLMHYSSKEIIEYSNQHSAGTRMPRVSWQSLKEFEIMIPDDKTIIEFEKITFPILKSIIQRIHENKTLTQLRDILLPKLMSGEVNVEQITAVA